MKTLPHLKYQIMYYFHKQGVDMTNIGTVENQIENYLVKLRDTVATLNIRIEELQTTLSQIRGKISQLKMDDQIHIANKNDYTNLI
jgi:hypothetical protein